MIKAIIFDCFGVFVGNPYKERVAILETQDPELADQIRAINRAADRGFLTSDEAREHMAPLLNITYEELTEEFNRGEILNERLVAFAKTLRPKYKVALLSNVSGRDRLEMRFQPEDLNELFDVVVASGDVGIIKPEPDIYTLTAERLGVLPEECVMLDDIREFCDGAESVGMQSVQFISTDQGINDITLLIDRGEQR